LEAEAATLRERAATAPEVETIEEVERITATAPPGFDPIGARTMARSVATDIARNSYSYSRSRLREFQTKAGITVDGYYGGQSRGALAFYGVSDAPRALFRPTTTVPYNPTLARLASQIESGA